MDAKHALARAGLRLGASQSASPDDVAGVRLRASWPNTDSWLDGQLTSSDKAFIRDSLGVKRRIWHSSRAAFLPVMQVSAHSGTLKLRAPSPPYCQHGKQACIAGTYICQAVSSRLTYSERHHNRGCGVAGRSSSINGPRWQNIQAQPLVVQVFAALVR